jgi:tetratricopeptide (TPR) repeat protein
LYNVLGICFLGLHKYNDAIAAHTRYLELSPKESNAHDSLGMSYQQAGRYRDAIAEYNSALLLDPSFEPAIIHLGDTYSQQGRYRDGIREYQRYIHVTRSNAARAVAYGNIAQLCRKQIHFALGELAAEREASYEPGAVWNSLMFALDRGDTVKATHLRQRLFQDSPYPERGVRNEMRSHDYYLGTLALKNNQVPEALIYFKQALSHLPPSSGLDLYEDCLANAYLELGQLDDAINEYQRILSFNPNYPLAQYHLAVAYERKRDVRSAQLAYCRFLNSWKDADPDIPEIAAANSSLSRLSRSVETP